MYFTTVIPSYAGASLAGIISNATEDTNQTAIVAHLCGLLLERVLEVLFLSPRSGRQNKALG
jgi:hypothetical protein